MKVTFIDVGQGDAALIECPGGKTMLIDGGGLVGSRFDIGEQVVSQVLWRKGMKTIDYLVCTHPHPDHYQGFLSVSRNFHVTEFWEPSLNKAPPAYKNFTAGLDILRRRLCRGDRLQLGQVTIDVLHPPGFYSDPDLNNHSLVLRIQYGDHAFLFSGDIEKPAESDIVHWAGLQPCQVLKVPHHGSETSSSPDFLRSVSPHIAVFTAGKHNRYGFPRSSIVRRYRQAGVDIYRTDLHGAVEITSDGLRLSIRTSAAPLNPK